MKASTLILIIFTILLLAAASFGGGYAFCLVRHPAPEPVTDTVWRHDTVKLVQEKPVYKVVERLKVVHDTTGIASDANLLAQNDSLFSKSDSAAVEIPIVQRTYEGENYRAVVQGFRPELVSIDIRQAPEPPKHKWWSVTIGPQWGYGLTPAGWQPYAGVGATVGLTF